MIPLAVFEQVIDASGIPPRIEAILPIGVRARQLRVRTLLAGMCLTQADQRPAHLTRVHQALISLPEDDQRRLGVLADWKAGPHRLTYRQAEYTFGLIADGARPRTNPTGCPPAACSASAMTCWRHRSRKNSRTPAPRWRWTGRTWSPSPGPRRTAQATAPTPRRPGATARTTCSAAIDELFFGYYLSAGTMEREENGAEVPELARRMTLCSCCRDPVRALLPVLTAMPAAGIPLGDILDDCGYSHRDADAWAIPLRAAGGAPGPGPAPARPRPEGHPRRRHHRQREPLLPVHAPHAAGTRTARPHRHQRAGCGPGPQDQPSWPGTSSAASPPTTKTATTGCSAPPRWARSAARSAPPR